MIGQGDHIQVVQAALGSHLMRPVCVIFGPSGVGKTTLARLIAMWQCCTNRTEEPCGECQNCTAILDDTHPDVVEFDGGTYTSVEHIRSITSSINYTTANFNTNAQKVYILDEVHMISRHAMTALLKEFEGDLKSVQFILATTNIEKLPVAIVSRALPVRLGPVSESDLSKYISIVAQSNGYAISSPAVDAIVYCADGSVRQALSLFEQVSIVSRNIDENMVRRLSGLALRESISSIVESLENRSLEALLSNLGSITDADPENVVAQVLSEIHVRIKNKNASKMLIVIGNLLAEGAITIHNLPYSKKLLEIIFGYALLKAQQILPETNLSQLAEKMFK